MFVVSKLFSAITQPMFWLFIWMLAALVFFGKKKRPALIMLWFGMVVWGLLGITAIPNELLRQLEIQHKAALTSEIGSYVGVIVLGGAMGNSEVFKAYGQVSLGEAAERMTVPLELMRSYPNLKLVFSGGEGGLVSTGTTEAELARIFYEQQGIDITRVIFEHRARNTRENARFVSDLIGDQCKEPWLLVTTASHMPRSMTEFESS
jgi:uncharacterized SAM-binding protein YcdF (DUF218 family)